METRVPPDITRRYGVEEIHHVAFLPPGDDGIEPLWRGVAIEIPEFLSDLELAIAQCVAINGRFVAACDTAQQAKHVIATVERLAPGFTRADLDWVIAHMRLH